MLDPRKRVRKDSRGIFLFIAFLYCFELGAQTTSLKAMKKKEGGEHIQKDNYIITETDSIFFGNTKKKRRDNYSLEQWIKQRKNSLERQSTKEGDIHFRYAYMLFSEGHYERAHESWNNFIFLFPAHPRKIEAMGYVALIAEKQGHYRSAMESHIQAYHEAPSEEPGIKSYLEAGRLALRLGEMSLGKRIFREIARKKKAPNVSKMAKRKLDALRIDSSEN